MRRTYISVVLLLVLLLVYIATKRIQSAGCVRPRNVPYRVTSAPYRPLRSTYDSPNVPRLNLILRGHLRDALQSNGMRVFISELKRHYDIFVCIHTWDRTNSSSSWRDVPTSETHRLSALESITDVHAKTIEIESSYFENAPVYANDSKISNTKMPTRGWRQYLYGLSASSMLVEPDDTKTISMRIDFFDGCFACKQLVDSIHNLVHNIVRMDTSRISLLCNGVGCDNMILATAGDMRWLCNGLLENFDHIRNGVFKPVEHQELIVRDYISAYHSLSTDVLTPLESTR